MVSKVLYSAAFVAFCIVVYACSTTLYLPTQADAQKTDVSIDTLTIGRNIYINNCGSCHRLHSPESFSKKEWTDVLPSMFKKAKMKKDDARLVLSYIKTKWVEKEQ